MIAEPIFDVISDHGEGPIWDPLRQRLFWVDIVASRFFIGDPKSLSVEEHGVGSHLGALGLGQGDQLVLALRSGFALYNLKDRTLQHLQPEVLVNQPDVRFNDGAIDPAGGFFAGTMPYDCTRPLGKLYRLDTDHRWTKVSEPYTVCNGLAWSGDHKTCFFVDSPQHCVFAFDYDEETGALSNRRIQLDFGRDLIPDGMTIDNENGLWIAFWGAGQVRRYSLAGDLTEVVTVPAQHTTSCCFGGEHLNELYITTSKFELTREEQSAQPLSGRIFHMETSYQGCVESRFQG